MFVHQSDHMCVEYCIAGNFGEVFNWRFGKLGKIAKLKIRQFKLNACVPMVLNIQIITFKCRQY